MSTYTDLHNKIKENVVVDYKTRISPQVVKLYNEENEYWGTFKGAMLAEETKIKGGEIDNVLISNAKLSDVYFTNGLKIDDFGEQLELISVSLDQKGNKIEDLHSDDLYLSAKIDEVGGVNPETLTKLSTSILSEVSQVSSNIDNTIKNVVETHKEQHDNDISSINSELTFEENTRYNSDLYLSGEILQLGSALQAETTQRIRNDEQEILDRTEADNNLCVTLSIALNEDIENKKHYSHFDVDVYQDVYTLKDYSVNKVFTDLPVFFVKEGNVRVAKITDSNTNILSDLTDFTISFLNVNSNVPEEVRGKFYKITKDNPIVIDNQITIKYTKGVTPTFTIGILGRRYYATDLKKVTIADNQIPISNTAVKLYNAKVNVITSDDNTISSYELVSCDLNVANSEVWDFSGKYKFDNFTDEYTISVNGGFNKIVRDKNDFIFYRDYKLSDYYQVFKQNEADIFGIINKDYVKVDDDGSLDELSVQVTDCIIEYGKFIVGGEEIDTLDDVIDFLTSGDTVSSLTFDGLYTLTKQNEFEDTTKYPDTTIVYEDNKFKINYNRDKFDYVIYSEDRYNVFHNIGTVCPDIVNVKYVDNTNEMKFTTISVTIDVDENGYYSNYSKYNGTYELTKENGWKKTVPDLTNESIKLAIEYDYNNRQVKFALYNNDTTVTTLNADVNINFAKRNKEHSVPTTIFETAEIDDPLTIDFTVDEVWGTKYIVKSDLEAEQLEASRMPLDLTSYEPYDSIINLKLPTHGEEVLTEGIIHIKVGQYGGGTFKLNFTCDDNNTPIPQIYYNDVGTLFGGLIDYREFPVDKELFFRFNEVDTQNRTYIIEDVVEDYLYNLIKNENARAEAVEALLDNKINILSTSLSTEIINLSTSLSTEIINLSTSLSTEIDIISANIYNEIKYISDDILYLSTKHDNDISDIISYANDICANISNDITDVIDLHNSEIEYISGKIDALETNDAIINTKVDELKISTFEMINNVSSDIVETIQTVSSTITSDLSNAVNLNKTEFKTYSELVTEINTNSNNYEDRTIFIVREDDNNDGGSVGANYASNTQYILVKTFDVDGTTIHNYLLRLGGKLEDIHTKDEISDIVSRLTGNINNLCIELKNNISSLDNVHIKLVNNLCSSIGILDEKVNNNDDVTIEKITFLSTSIDGTIKSIDDNSKRIDVVDGNTQTLTSRLEIFETEVLQLSVDNLSDSIYQNTLSISNIGVQISSQHDKDMEEIEQLIEEKTSKVYQYRGHFATLNDLDNYIKEHLSELQTGYVWNVGNNEQTPPILNANYALIKNDDGSYYLDNIGGIFGDIYTKSETDELLKSKIDISKFNEISSDIDNVSEKIEIIDIKTDNIALSNTVLLAEKLDKRTFITEFNRICGDWEFIHDVQISGIPIVNTLVDLSNSVVTQIDELSTTVDIGFEHLSNTISSNISSLSDTIGVNTQELSSTIDKGFDEVSAYLSALDWNHVYMSEDLWFAGNYSQIGNIPKGSNANSYKLSHLKDDNTPKTIAELFKDIFTDEKDGYISKYPTMDRDGTSTNSYTGREVGDIITKPTYKLNTAKDGSYSYGPNPPGVPTTGLSLEINGAYYSNINDSKTTITTAFTSINTPIEYTLPTNAYITDTSTSYTVKYTTEIGSAPNRAYNNLSANNIDVNVLSSTGVLLSSFNQNGVQLTSITNTITFGVGYRNWFVVLLKENEYNPTNIVNKIQTNHNNCKCGSISTKTFSKKISDVGYTMTDDTKAIVVAVPQNTANIASFNLIQGADKSPLTYSKIGTLEIKGKNGYKAITYDYWASVQGLPLKTDGNTIEIILK